MSDLHDQRNCFKAVRLDAIAARILGNEDRDCRTTKVLQTQHIACLCSANPCDLHTDSHGAKSALQLPTYHLSCDSTEAETPALQKHCKDGKYQTNAARNYD